MPHAIKMYEKYAEQGLHVLLVHSQEGTREEIQAVMARTWSGRVPAGVLGENAPFQLEGNMLPKAAIVGVDGKIIWTNAGSSGSEKIIVEQLSQLHQVKPLDAALKSVTKDLNARALGKAAAAAQKVIDKPQSDKAKESAEALLAHLTKTVETRFASAKRLADRGRAWKAKQLLQQLSKQVAGDAAWSERAALAFAELDAAKDDAAADKLVAEAEEMLRERQSRPGAVGKLDEMLKKYSSAKVAAYAVELKKAAESKSALR